MTEAENTKAIAALLDKQSIAETLSAYCRGVDRIDAALIRSVFHPDAEADYGAMFSGTGYAFADFISEVHPMMESHAHHISGLSIVLHGDSAGSECYVLAWLRSRSEDGVVTDTVSHGRYVDQWERRNAVWRIKRRQYLHAMDETRVVENVMFEPGGSRDGSDPSYEVLDPRTND